jgi:hypothetical protein
VYSKSCIELLLAKIKLLVAVSVGPSMECYQYPLRSFELIRILRVNRIAPPFKITVYMRVLGHGELRCVEILLTL